MKLSSPLVVSFICVLAACGRPSVPSSSALTDVADVETMRQRDDGQFDITCKSGVREIATAAQIAENRVCNVAPPTGIAAITSLQARADGTYYVVCRSGLTELRSANEIREGVVCGSLAASITGDYDNYHWKVEHGCDERHSSATLIRRRLESDGTYVFLNTRSPSPGRWTLDGNDVLLVPDNTNLATGKGKIANDEIRGEYYNDGRADWCFEMKKVTP